MSHPHINLQPYQTADDTPTVTFVTAESSVAVPYHRVRELCIDPEGRRIVVAFDSREAVVGGSALGRLWRELRAFRVREIAINAGAAARQLEGEACCVRSIELKDKEPPDDAVDAGV